MPVEQIGPDTKIDPAGIFFYYTFCIRMRFEIPENKTAVDFQIG